MNTNKLKLFARAARTKLLESVETKLQWVLTNKVDNAVLLGKQREIRQLEERIATTSQAEVVEEVAYTWFNRLMALRFMDANGYNTPCIVTPTEGMTAPEILQEIKSGHIDERFNVDANHLRDLLDGRHPSPFGNADQEVYRLLLVAACNAWNSAMPFMFERISDYTELLLPDDLLSEHSIVTDIREGMSDEECQQEELLGWLYQFYIAEKKEVAELHKASKEGLKPEEIPAATQLFTPHWIVRYMVENSLGKIWLTLHPNSALIAQMPYYIAAADGVETAIPTDIKGVKDIRFIDPCMGSGHVLVYAFELFCKMYEEEGYSTSEIPMLIFENNIYGLDIDSRCTQLANFALSMKAQRYYRRFLRKAVKPQTIVLQNIPSEIIDGAGVFDEKSTIHLLTQANNLGSLISITTEDYDKINVAENNLWGSQTAVLKEVACLLSMKYHCVVTNPPYLGKGMNKELKDFVAKNFSDSKSDLMATFMERCLQMNVPNGYTAMINQHSWMFLSSYANLRKKVIEHSHIETLLHLGPRTFPEIGGEVVQNTAFVLRNAVSTTKGQFVRLVDFADANLKDIKTIEAIQNRTCGWIYTANQQNFNKIPGSPIGYWVSEKMIYTIEKSSTLSSIAKPRKGLVTLNDNHFIKLWSELGNNNIQPPYNTKEQVLQENRKWVFCNKGGGFCKWYGMNNYIIRWHNNGKELKDYIVKKYNGGSYTKEIRSEILYFQEGVTWGGVTSGLPSFRYFPSGYVFSSSGPSAFTDEKIYYILGLLNSSVSHKILELYSPTLSVLSGDIANIPFIFSDDLYKCIDSIVKRSIEISKLDWDSHETSWDFQQNELFKHRLNTVQAAYERYTAEWTSNFMQLHANEEELNRQFIDIYDLQDELTPDVPLKEITILQQGEIKIVENTIEFQPAVVLKQFISYAVGCMLGRYSLDKSGLILANQGETLQDYLQQVPAPTFMPDEDAIIPVLEGEYFDDDITERFSQFLQVTFGEAHHAENLQFFTDHVGDLRKYFFKEFYTDHVQRYKKRPIYWMFTSAKGSFKALVYMHRMQADTPSKILSDYLQPYINKMEDDRLNLVEKKLREDITPRERIAITKQHDALIKVLTDCRDYEKTLLTFASTRPTIDLDNGVKVNYTQFKKVLVPIKGLEKE